MTDNLAVGGQPGHLTESHRWTRPWRDLFGNHHCGEQLISVPEGGYDLRALGASAAAHMAAPQRVKW